MKRKPLSKRTRFEVFKRDKFCCQYCGAKAPDVVLHVDHIHPVALGGKNDALNLITSCAACNGGKGATSIADGSAINKQRDQLAALEERRQQIEMMLEWRSEMASQNDIQLEAAAAAWTKAATGWAWNERGRAIASAALKKHGLMALLDAIDSTAQRFPTASVEKPDALTLDKMMKHWQTVLKYGNDPNGREIAYTIGILKNRCSDRQTVYFADLKSAVDAGIPVEWLKQTARESDSWYEFATLCTDRLNRGRQ